MLALVKKELKDNQRSLLIWLGAMFGMLIIGAAEYGIVMEAGDEIMELFDSLPQVLSIIFGAESVPVHTPIGYYVMMYLWYCIIAFTHAAVLGAIIISKEERNRTAEFTFTKPFARSQILTSKMIAAIINVFIMAFMTLLGNLILLYPQMEGESILNEILLTMFAMYVIQLLFLFTGLLFSVLFSNYKTALSISAVFVFITYTLRVIIVSVGNLDFLNLFSPFMYFTGPNIVDQGLNLFYLGVTIAVILVSAYFMYTKFENRDLHN